MSDMFDKSLIAWGQRRSFLEKHKYTGESAYVLLWVLSKEGNVFGTTIPLGWIGPNSITRGSHEGLLWWPQEF